MAETEHWLRAGVVGRPHGLDGSFHVVEPVATLLEMGAEVRVGEVRWEIVRVAGHDGRPIVRLEGCDERRAAEALSGQELLVSRTAAPDLEEDEWWATDLEGCAVRDGDREVGVVARLLALPSCEVLEVTRAGDAPALLVPLVRDAVRDVDLEERVIDVDLQFLGEA
ncbi:MAG TPA: ribosome maturation factor RimM [Solirubrobacteraceae bacterium]|nr:ribosome maturation factor RimM [Solirubrobacteraceae bacterium]